MFLQHYPDLELKVGLSSVHVIVDRADWEKALELLNQPRTLTLSQRNVLALLHKLYMEGSSRTILKPDPNGRGHTAVTIVSDKEAYKNRAPGVMHGQTEMFIGLMERALRKVRVQMVCDSNPPEWAYAAARLLADANGRPCLDCNNGSAECEALNLDAATIAAAHDIYYEEFPL
jgi:hypothetical protein